MALAWLHFPAYAQSLSMQVAAIVVAGAYLILALRFWFWGPVVGTGIGLVCFLTSAFLVHTT